MRHARFFNKQTDDSLIRYRHNMKTQQQGFTLIELMIAVLILAILATIAYPSYETYVRQTRLENVRADLMINAQMVERHYAQNRRFPHDQLDASDVEQLKKLKESLKQNEYFNISYQASGENNYILTAKHNDKNPNENRYMKIDGNGVVTLCKENASANDECYMYK